jgi:hypothetical protein
MYYTYAYLREDGTPYYIGKGKGDRAYKHSLHRLKPPSEDRIKILKKNLTEVEAFEEEIRLIAEYGRKDLETGILRNMTDGGEGPSGRINSPENRAGISKRMKGNTYAKNRKDLTSIGKKISAAKKGKKFTKEHREALSKAHIGENKKRDCYGKFVKNES